MMIVIQSDAIHQPYTMVVVSRNTCPAEAAMLTPCRLVKLTCTAVATWVKDDFIIRIAFHFLRVVFGCDERFCDNALIEKEIWQGGSNGHAEPMGRGDPGPRTWNEHALPCYEERRKEYLLGISTKRGGMIH